MGLNFSPTFTAEQTRSSAIADGPRDASCQLKSCQLPRNSAETTRTISPEEIEVMKLEGYSGPMCNKHVHKTMTRALGVCMKKLGLDVYLEHFGGGALEQLDVAGSDALFVFRQSVGDVVVAGKQHERVSSRSAV